MKPVFQCDDAAADEVSEHFKPVMIPGRLTEQLNKGFFVVNHARHAFLHKKGTRTLRVKSHGSAVAGLREEQAFTPGPHDMMQRPEPVKRAHR